MDKLALITGATSGIGRATALALARSGYNIAVCGRREDQLEMIKESLEGLHTDIYTFYLDVRDKDLVKREVDKLIEKAGHIDLLVNSAGLASGLEYYQDCEFQDIDDMFDTNVKGLAYVTRAVLPHMIERNEGHIINLGSTAGIYAYAKGAVYCATKAAVKTLSDGIRIDTLHNDIKVTTIQPGIVETPFSEVRFHGDKKRAALVYKGIDALQPEDIADVICYVANQPKHVQISDVTIMAAQQATGFTIARKEEEGSDTELDIEDM